MSLSKNQIKLVRSLNQKKSRHKHGLFVVEGTKTVQEFLSSSFELDTLFVTDALHSIFDAFNVQVVVPSEMVDIDAACGKLVGQVADRTRRNERYLNAQAVTDEQTVRIVGVAE